MTNATPENAIMKNLRIFLLCLFLLPAFFAFYPQNGGSKDTIKLQLKWKHQFQFAGYYAAIKQGFYAQKGLTVVTVEADGDRDPDYNVIEGKAQFGISNSAIVKKRAEGSPVVVLAPVFQHSPLVLLTLASSGLKYAQDLKGKKIMLESQEADIVGYLNDEGLKQNDYQHIEHTFDIGQLINGKVDAISGYLTDETYYLKNKDIDYNIINPVSGGIDFYGDVLFTTEKMIKENPGLVHNFVEATLKGWVYAMQNREELVNYIYDSLTQRHSREHLMFEADAMKQFVKDDYIEIGYSNKGRWQKIINTFAQVGLIAESFAPDDMLYTPPGKEPQFIFSYKNPFVSVSFFVGLVAAFFYFYSRRLRREIESRKLLQKELEEKDELFRLLANNAEDVIWTMNEKGEFTFVSPSVQKLRGYTPEEVKLQSLEEVLCPGSLEIVQNSFANNINRIANGEKIPEESYILEQPCKDGTTVWTDLRVNGMYDEQGNFRGFLGITRNINEKKKAQDELNESKRFLSELIDNSPALIYVKDKEGKYLLANKTWEHFSHTPRESAMGKTDTDVYGEEIGSKYRENDLKVLREKRVIDYEEFLVHDGKRVLFKTIKFPLTNAAGEIDKVCGITLDITAQKLAEEEKLRNEAIWRTVVTASPDGIAITTIDGIITWASPKIFDMWGYDETDTLVGMHLTELVHSSERESVSELISRVGKGINTGTAEQLMVRKDGTIFYTESNAELLHNPDGTPSGILLVERDITERKIADNIMEENEKRFRLIFENAPVGIIQYDQSGNLTSCNDNFARLVGQQKLQLVTFNMLKLRDPHITELVQKSLQGERGVFEGEFTISSLQKVKSLRIVLTPMYSAGNEIIGGIGMVEDISERLENELRIARYTAELERLNEDIKISHLAAEDALVERNKLIEELAVSNSEKDKFFAIIAHDLRSPFQSFIGLTEEIIRPGTDYTIEEITEFNRELHDSAVKLYKLLQNLLEWARMQQQNATVDPITVSADAVLKDNIHRVLKSAEQKDINIYYSSAIDYKIVADLNMINSVLLNLLTNAVKFTPEQGKIFVSLAAENNNAVITIKDTGIGMDEELKNDLFRIDKKVGRKGTRGEESTGLGLLLAKEFINKNNGTIRVESSPGTGSTFTVTLPLAQ